MRRAFLALAVLAAAPAAGQPLVVSPGPDAVSVTVYRDPDHDPGDPMNLDWLEGFALITETRTVRLPAGESVVRFEGVAGGIEPASAIAAGLPGGVDEKNRDARLISPGALVERSLGRRVHIRRTNPKTGAAIEEEAVIRSGPDGVILQTRDGFEALRCSGLPETLTFDGVPEDLSATPTLAVTTRSPEAATVTVKLSYLARQFDWEANYVAHVAEDGKTLDLFAWLTLANGNDESFVQAQTQAVAGTVNRDENAPEEPRAVSSPIEARCWPRGSTSDFPLINSLPPAVPGAPMEDSGDIIVTGSRIRRANLMSAMPVTVISAQQEELGDLKLYRIPEPVTVAAHAQKQVALLSRSKVPFERVYSVSLTAGEELDEPRGADILLRTKNVKGKNLGLPLPMGNVAVFEPAGGRMMLVGEAPMADSAVGQDVEILTGQSSDILAVQRRLGPCGSEDAAGCDDDADERALQKEYVVELSNARAQAVRVEVLLPLYRPWDMKRPSGKLVSRNGQRLWIARVPANGRARFRFLLRRDPPKKDDDES